MRKRRICIWSRVGWYLSSLEIFTGAPCLQLADCYSAERTAQSPRRCYSTRARSNQGVAAQLHPPQKKKDSAALTFVLKPKAYSSKRALNTDSRNINSGKTIRWRELECPLLCVDHGGAEQELLLLLFLLSSFLLWKRQRDNKHWSRQQDIISEILQFHGGTIFCMYYNAEGNSSTHWPVGTGLNY